MISQVRYGWSAMQNNYNFYVREQSTKFLYIAESHLINNDEIHLSGYSWFGNNRKSTHIIASSDSGGGGLVFQK